MFELPPPIKSALRPTFFSLYRAAIRLHCWYSDRINTKRHDVLPVPPAILRFRVGESISVETFFDVGKNTVRDIEVALESVGKPIEGFNSILDFGCGCGRTLMWLAKTLPGKKFYGTDVDESSVRWCQTNLHYAECTVNASLPPTMFSDGNFDLVYAISVFTHINEGHQLEWLPELHRILKPGGLLVLTVHGKHSWQGLLHEDVQILEERGFLFKTSSKLHGFVPDWYHTAYHSRKYVMRTFSSTFKILAYMEGGLGYQDLIVLERS
jgi:SAM-dependent methyltransferase